MIMDKTDYKYAVSVISSPSESKWLWSKHNISSHSEMNHDNYIQQPLSLSLQTLATLCSVQFSETEVSRVDNLKRKS